MSLTLLGTYIDKLRGCLEEADCVDPTLVGIVIILLLYIDDIILMAMSHYDLDNQLKILKDLWSSMGMTINTDKTKVMIIKAKRITYANFVYYKNNMEEVTSYKYFKIDLHHKIN
jgi:hypothetical protein